MLCDSWCCIGDFVCMEVDGMFWYEGWVDDVFKVVGYCIGLGEIENCLFKYLVVVNVVVVFKLDVECGVVVKVYVVLVEGYEGDVVFVEVL